MSAAPTAHLAPDQYRNLRRKLRCIHPGLQQRIRLLGKLSSGSRQRLLKISLQTSCLRIHVSQVLSERRVLFADR
jgi:hypothetical protein